jgi:hypothetical protein
MERYMARLRAQMRNRTGICSPEIEGSGPLRMATSGHCGGNGLKAPGRVESQSRKARFAMNWSATIL